jgi:transglutaminase-like putative cysteine protease
LKITHETLYEYRAPVSFGEHRVILRPREGHDLQVMSMVLDITPAHEVLWSRDVFGNSVATVSFLEPAAALRIVSRVSVDTGALPKLAEAPHTAIPYPVVYDEEEMVVADAYKKAIYPSDAAAVNAWLQAAIRDVDGNDAAALVLALNQFIKREINYRRRVEKGVQTPAETIALKSGSCRDMATLLMEACRTLGIASRFSSGYLDCVASTAGIASTHAWTEVYFPARGWSGFDPTLGEETSQKHIAVGVSNHPRAVMPVSGRFFGTKADFVGMTVSVKFEKSA